MGSKNNTPEVVVAYMHENGAIWRLDNCPTDIDFTKPGWTALYAKQLPSAPAPEGYYDHILFGAIPDPKL